MKTMNKILSIATLVGLTACGEADKLYKSNEQPNETPKTSIEHLACIPDNCKAVYSLSYPDNNSQSHVLKGKDFEIKKNLIYIEYDKDGNRLNADAGLKVNGQQVGYDHGVKVGIIEENNQTKILPTLRENECAYLDEEKTGSLLLLEINWHGVGERNNVACCLID